MNRREFSIFTLATLGVAAGGGYALRAYEPRSHLRPPGGVERFESLCIKCGQCVQVCPYHSIKLLGADDGVNIATAYIDPYERGCYLCDLFPCVLACPSGALAHETTTIEDVKMGVAVVSNLNACYSNLKKSVEEKDVTKLLKRKTYNEREEVAKKIIADNVGKTCSLCVDSCPVEGAIEINGGVPVIKQKCVGCGVCAEVCFARVIEIAPNKTYKDIYEG